MLPLCPSERRRGTRTGARSGSPGSQRSAWPALLGGRRGRAGPQAEPQSDVVAGAGAVYKGGVAVGYAVVVGESHVPPLQPPHHSPPETRAGRAGSDCVRARCVRACFGFSRDPTYTMHNHHVHNLVPGIWALTCTR